jgi:hypothetical protein
LADHALFKIVRYVHLRPLRPELDVSWSNILVLPLARGCLNACIVQCIGSIPHDAVHWCKHTVYVPPHHDVTLDLMKLWSAMHWIISSRCSDTNYNVLVHCCKNTVYVPPHHDVTLDLTKLWRHLRASAMHWINSSR